MYAGRFELGCFGNADEKRESVLSIRAIAHMCTALYKIDCEYLSANPAGHVDLYDSGVFYQTPESECGGDVWQDILTLYTCKAVVAVSDGTEPCLDPFCGHNQKFGDCKDLACARAAELTVKYNIRAVPIVRRRWLSLEFALYHVVVQYPDGTIEDPSALLGMPAANGA